ncbi:extracellular solute-binding protein [Paenibacillus sp. LjRoot153]|uniref:extracellular solute-binding protein n=1 Tax=unclassified Paenibacillus TaxID=185978 RepID=UPI00070D1353|nr:extracellular solute-binding protein [Paenibacillus sp. Soil766]KRF09745.1 hypothetical protein ASG89_16160 [Paenibacillus sp. Soil766]
MKKWIAVSFVALSAVLTITACSKEKEVPSASQGTESAKPEAKKNISVSIYDRGNIPQGEGSVDKNRWTEWLNSKAPANVSFIPIPRNESVSKLNVLFASGSAPDLIFDFDSNYRNQLFTQKQLMPLDELIDKYSVEYKKRLQENPLLKTATTFDDGKIYAFGRLQNTTPGGALVIRTDWLKKLGLQAPKTPEEMLNVAKAFASQDPDGNGKQDTYGFALSSWNGAVIDHMFGSAMTFQDKIPFQIQSDIWTHDWERAKSATEFKKKMFESGVVDKDFLTDKDGNKAKQDFLSGKLGMAYLLVDPKAFETFWKNNPQAELDIISYPTTAYGQYGPLWNNPVQAVGVINESAKNPEAIMKYVDFTLKQETSNTMVYGTEGQHYKVENGCPKPTLTEENKNQVGSYTKDYVMLYNQNFEDPKCKPAVITDANLQKKYEDWLAADYKTYKTVNPALPVIHPENMPALPKDLATSSSSALSAIWDIWQKSIVSGASYTVDAAFEESKAYWDKSNGQKIDSWYKDYYAKNKSRILNVDQLNTFRK